MTTLRVTRRHRDLRADVAAAERSAFPAGLDHADDTAVRLALIDPVDRHSTLDGAWWPRTTDLTDELPSLIAELHRQGIRVTRVAYNPTAWAPVTRRLPADGRTVRLGAFRSLDPHLLNLTGDERRGRLDLLTVPPGTTRTHARRAFSAATDRANRQGPTALLDGLAAPAAGPASDLAPGPADHPTRRSS
jgi:hypothetical protein